MTPPALMEELLGEVLLRIPPDDPKSLLRAALVCKRWCRLVSGPSFRRRFREFHRAPPMLGFLCDLRGDDDTCVSRFVPTSSFCPPRAVRGGWRAVDSRHGRVLLHALPWRFAPFQNVLVVWDPITNERLEVPKLPRVPHSWSAAVLCAAAGTCDHLDCHRGPFTVVFVGTDMDNMFSCVYSSVAGAWSEPASAEHPGDCVESVPSALVGNALYFLLQRSARILKYDLGERAMSVIHRPPACSYYQGRVVLMSMEDGRLGFASVHESRLNLWLREVGSDGEARWVESGVIELEMLLPVDALLTLPYLIGFADGAGVLFMWTAVGGILLVNLKSGQVRSMHTDSDIYGVVPYMSFYTPALRIASTGDRPSAGA